MATVQPQLRAAFDSTNAEIRVVLTPEQRKTLADKMQKRHEMMQRHMRERQELEGRPKS